MFVQRLTSLAPVFVALQLIGCGAAPAPVAAPCFSVRTDSELRASDAHKILEDLAHGIKLPPEDEALRKPTSMANIREIMRRDTVYLFSDAAAFARSLDSTEGRFSEAALELAMGESQLVASQILTTQSAWVGNDLRIARANVATEGDAPSTDRGRMLVQLIRVVEEGNKIADALGIVAPKHLRRGAAVVVRLQNEAPSDPHTALLVAEYHRLRGEWPEFEAAMTSAEASAHGSPPLCYLRAMEQLERFHKADAGSARLRECLQKYPRFVRAQAALVLMASDHAAALRELHALKVMNEDHYLVMLLEPTLAAEHELWRMQNGGANAAR
jgi:hypothetical protein